MMSLNTGMLLAATEAAEAANGTANSSDVHPAARPCSLTPHLCSPVEYGYTLAIRERLAAARTPMKPALVKIPGGVKLSFDRASSASPVGLWWPIDNVYSLGTANASAAPSWIIPPRARWGLPCTGATLHLPVVACFSFFAGNYGHSLHDFLPVLAWLRVVRPGHTVIAPYSAVLRDVLDFLDRENASKRSILVGKGVVKCATSASVLAVPPNARKHLNFAWVRTVSQLKLLRNSWLQPAGILRGFSDGAVIVYLRPASRTVHHGRNMERGHTEAIVQTVQEAMLRFGLRGQLVRYDGTKQAASMPVAHQIQLFSRADTVIGPHGAGLANVLWLPARRTREHVLGCNRPLVLEFICSGRSTRVQEGCPYGRSHWSMFGVAPWVQWYHQFFTDKSSPVVTWIDIVELQLSLTAMWSNPSVA